MKALAINGSARKGWNTEAMLLAALKGAETAGAETKIVNLFDLDYKGCRGCSACKLLGGPFYGACAQRDGLTPVLEEAKAADVLFLGSPMYFNDVTGMMRSFLERFFFPTLTYSKDHHLLYPKKIKVGLIYTSNAPEGVYTEFMAAEKKQFERLIGPAETIIATETWQFNDYSKYDADMFDVEARRARHEQVFPRDCAAAEELGRRLALMEI